MGGLGCKGQVGCKGQMSANFVSKVMDENEDGLDI